MANFLYISLYILILKEYLYKSYPKVEEGFVKNLRKCSQEKTLLFDEISVPNKLI